MCGRYSAAGNLNEMAKLLDCLCRNILMMARYNIAPRQQAPVIVLENHQPLMKMMRWGLLPSWTKDESLGDKLINARAETIAQKTSFRRPFNSQRCLIPADGFYEWQRRDKSFTPFRFTMRDHSWFCFAGIYETWIRPPRAETAEFDFNDLDEPPPSRVIETFSIITTQANPMVATVHERMPVILYPQDWLRWIDNDRVTGTDVQFLLRPIPAEHMDCCRISNFVNNARHDTPECLQPA